MALSNAQVLVLKAAILAETDPVFVGYRTEGSTGLMAEWFNEPSTFVVWRTSVSEHEIVGKTSPEGTTWSWSSYISRSQGERDGWARMFNGTYTVNPSLPQVRQGMADIFSGGTGNGQRTHLLAIGKRNATRGEKVFATGLGTTPSPGDLVFEGNISDVDVIRALSA